MLELPRSTEFNKRIPKQKFYENLQITPALKKSFVDQIKVIHWRNKIAATTVNLAPGEQVTELEVFSIRLNEGSLNIWKFMVHVLLKPGLENFEHYFTSV